MNNLVILKNNDCFTNSLVISKGTKNKHRSIQRLIEKYKNVFEKFGKVRFEITPSGKTKQNLTVYLLNEQQATLDLANVMELNNLSLIENIILNVIRTGMSASKFYKDIYRDSKKALETFNKVAFL